MAQAALKLAGLAALAMAAACSPAPKEQASTQTTQTNPTVAVPSLMPATPIETPVTGELAPGPSALPADLQAITLAVFTPGVAAEASLERCESLS